MTSDQEKIFAYLRIILFEGTMRDSSLRVGQAILNALPRDDILYHISDKELKIKLETYCLNLSSMRAKKR